MLPAHVYSPPNAERMHPFEMDLRMQNPSCGRVRPPAVHCDCLFRSQVPMSVDGALSAAFRGCSMFQAVYYVVKNFLDPVTRAKLHFLNDSDDSAMQVKLLLL